MPARTEKAALRQPLWSVVAAEMLLDRIVQGAAIVSWDGKMTYANHPFAAMAGLQRSLLPGSPLANLVPDSERERLGVALGAGRDAPIQQRFTLLRAGASELPVLMSFAPLAHGQASCLVADLREQKRREESADRLSTFLGTLAHELGNILSPMRNSLGLLHRTQGLDDDARHAVASAQRQAERMLALVEDLRKING